jgi:uncharacterized protein YecT (DUF1311 family)
MLVRALALAIGLIAAAGAGPGAAETGPKPSFDCAKAAAPVERAICAGTDSLAELDRALDDLYRAILASSELEIRMNVERAQSQWLARRNSACGRAAPDAGCLARLYKARIVELVATWRAFGGAPAMAITGRYAYRERGNAGEMFVAEMPDGTTYVQVETANTGRNPHSCTFSERIKERRASVLVHRDPAASKSCGLEIEFKGNGAVLRETPKDCFELAREWCGMRGYMLGNYQRR